MNQTLDVSEQKFRELLEQCNQLILNRFEDLEHQKAYRYFSQPMIESWFKEPLPQKPTAPSEVLNFIEQKVLKTATNNLGPHMYGYVMAGGNQMSIIGETLATTINQNATKWHLGPAVAEVEKAVIRWTNELLELPIEGGGVLVSGGSAANLTGLTVARNLFFEQMDIRKKGLFGIKPFTIYASNEVHSCIDKSAELLGIGSNQVRKIKTNPDFTINLEALEQQIETDITSGFLPFCIIGNAGTVNTGAIDDLKALSKIAKKYKLWFHIDGAYGALASAVADVKSLYAGMDEADSIALDFHKWLYQPFEAGCTLVKNYDQLRRTYFKKADYLDTEFEMDKKRLEFNEHYFQLSRNSKALKIWISLKTYGFEAIQAMIKKDIDLAAYLAKLTAQAPDFKLMAGSPLAVTCFWYTGNLTDDNAIEALNKNLISALEKDGRVFITGTRLNGKFVLRACLINHRKTKETTEFLLKVVREVGTKLLELTEASE